MIFVLGSGRSGTSSVARVLHENSIACMGHKFAGSDSSNLLGYWEDLEIRQKYMPEFISGAWQTFIANVQGYHTTNEEACKSTLLGYKHPMLCEIQREIWLALQPTIIYWCTRSKKQVIASMVKKGGKRRHHKMAIDFYNFRMHALENNIEGLPFVKKLDFEEYRTDKWILNQILSSL